MTFMILKECLIIVEGTSCRAVIGKKIFLTNLKKMGVYDVNQDNNFFHPKCYWYDKSKSNNESMSRIH